MNRGRFCVRCTACGNVDVLTFSSSYDGETCLRDHERTALCRCGKTGTQERVHKDDWPEGAWAVDSTHALPVVKAGE